jgi:tRNA A-37 threonylcarbamoyl transferase component Bud32
LDLFNQPTTTVGFRYLVSILSAKLETLGYSRIDDVTVDGVTFKVRDVLGRGGQHIVYKCLYGFKEIALKMSSTSSDLRGQLRNERLKIDELRKLLGNPKFLPEVIKHNSVRSALLIEPVGESIKSWYQEHAIGGDENTHRQCLSNIGLDILQILESLHRVQICHADLQPANFIVHDDDIILIDWTVSVKEGNEVTNFHAGYACDERLYSSELSPFMEYRPEFELETFIYLMFGISYSGHVLPWQVNEEQTPAMKSLSKIADKRREYFIGLEHRHNVGNHNYFNGFFAKLYSDVFKHRSFEDRLTMLRAAFTGLRKRKRDY